MVVGASPEEDEGGGAEFAKLMEDVNKQLDLISNNDNADLIPDDISHMHFQRLCYQEQDLPDPVIESGPTIGDDTGVRIIESSLAELFGSDPIPVPESEPVYMRP